MDPGEATVTKTMTVRTYNTAPYGNDVEFCVYDDQTVAYDPWENIFDDENHDVSWTASAVGDWFNVGFTNNWDQLWGWA